MKSFSVRPFRKGDEEEIVQLLQRVFDGWPRFDLGCSPVEHWRWKYIDNPLRGNVVTLAESGGEIIGVRHSLLKEILVNNSPFLWKYSADAAVDPAFRNMGVSKRMVELSRVLSKQVEVDYVYYVYYVSSNPIMVEHWLRTKRNPFPHDVSNLVWIQDIDRQMSAMPIDFAGFYKLGFKAVRSLNQMSNLLRKSVHPIHDLEIHKIDRFDERANAFWNDIRPHYRFISKRDVEYLNWRYCDLRAGDFVVKQAEWDEKILGYIILSLNRYQEDYPVGYIVDLLALPERLDVTDALARDALTFFSERGVNIVNCQVVRGHPYEGALKGSGFVDSRIRLHLFYRSYGPTDLVRDLDSTPPEELHFMYGDIDSLPSTLPQTR